MSDAEDPRQRPQPERDLSDPAYRAAVVDLLGALAYGELRAFSQLARDSELAPTLGHKSAIALLAAHELRSFRLLRERLTALGADPQGAMQPFVEAVDAFHTRTAANDWLEGLVKAYVGDGIAQDFYREIANYVDEDTKALVLAVLEDQGQADFAVSAVRQAIN